MPTEEYLLRRNLIGFSVYFPSDDASDVSFTLNISFPYPNIRLSVEDLTSGQVVVDLRSIQRPKLHEWSRIEIGHIEEGGNYFVTLSLGGQELGRKACRLMGNVTKIKISYGSTAQFQPGFVRGLVVLDKQ